MRRRIKNVVYDDDDYDDDYEEDDDDEDENDDGAESDEETQDGAEATVASTTRQQDRALTSSARPQAPSGTGRRQHPSGREAKTQPPAGGSAKGAASASTGTTPSVQTSASRIQRGSKAPTTRHADAKTARSLTLNAASRDDESPPMLSQKDGVRSKHTDVDTLDSLSDEKPSLNLVVVGHVDAGKSTLMGHLLVKKGHVTSRQIARFREESKQIGKESFAYAWVLDEGTDERERGVTIDVCVKQFQTATKNVCILDAPGHRDFVPNMLMAAVQADVALLVVDAKDFHAGFTRGGQTKEHIQLVRALGITKIIVAVNKLDAVMWEREPFEYVKAQLLEFMTGPEVAFKPHMIDFVPVSAFSGVNLVDNDDSRTTCPQLYAWWEDGPTLEGLIDTISLPAVTDDGTADRQSGLLMACVSDVLWTSQKATVSAKIEAGRLSKQATVLVLPSKRTARVLELDVRGKRRQSCQKGDFVERLVLDLDHQYISLGSVLCSPEFPLPVLNTMVAKIVVFDTEFPILPGLQLMAYIHTLTQPAEVRMLLATFNKSTGQRESRKPRILMRGDIALVELHVPSPVCVSYQQKSAPVVKLSRIILRYRGVTAAAGMIVDPKHV